MCSSDLLYPELLRVSFSVTNIILDWIIIVFKHKNLSCFLSSISLQPSALQQPPLWLSVVLALWLAQSQAGLGSLHPVHGPCPHEGPQRPRCAEERFCLQWWVDNNKFTHSASATDLYTQISLFLMVVSLFSLKFIKTLLGPSLCSAAVTSYWCINVAFISWS